MAASTRRWLAPVLLLLGFLLAGCASDAPVAGKNRHRFQVGRPNYTVAPYQVNGVWYHPRVDYNYDETGTASWYGPGFDGRPTSDGEIYDMNQLTAAHKTLPLPSVVQVTNLQNGRALRLRVNDRGPFVDNRLIDLSRRAAQLLGFEGMGMAPVRVRIMKEESIEVAQAAMRGETGQVMLAAVPTATGETVASAAPRPARRSTPATRFAAAGPASLHAREVIAGPIPAETPPAAPVPAVVERAPQTASPPYVEPAPAAAPAAVAAASRRAWPGLIASAQAEPMRPAAARRSGRIFIQAGAFAMPENAQRVRARIAALGNAEVVPMTSRGAPLYRVRLGPVASEAEAARLLRQVVGNGVAGARVVAE